MPAGAFALHLQALLRARELSYRTLAAQTYYSKSYLHDLACGRKAPSPEVAQRLDDALDAGGGLAALASASDPREQRTTVSDRPGRPDPARLADLLVTETPTAENAVELAHQWLITDPPQRYELDAGRRVGDSTVERVRQRVRQLRRLDDHLGGSETYAMVTAELAETVALLREGSHSEPVGGDLLVVIADLCQLAGFVAEDSGRIAEARRHHLAGMRAAHEGGDAAGAANCLSSLSYLEANAGDRRAAVTLARSAHVGGRDAAEATGRALLLERVAWAHARLGEASLAERALGAVEDIYPDHGPEEAPSWAYWLTRDEVEIMTGRVWTELSRPLRAVPVLERAIARYGDDSPRETSLYTTWLAQALLQAGEAEHAALTAGRALDFARRARSQRAVERVMGLREALALVAGDSRAVIEFLELSADLSVANGGHPGGH
ncbi:helix-turn-helix domain-containing protein [Micromonospora sp. NBS 11-29]|uniref:helix-turn-helix domain-containing protein n=1 Tax=Micromonospora sp. NBS 11-29 TaxID=1960879 RepID=UPI000B780E19|nr:helix-turn-helix transcriptional regulator [Micromonospora sp. NBS 11-29]